MKRLLLLGAALFLSGCGVTEEEVAEESEGSSPQPVQSQPAPELEPKMVTFQNAEKMGFEYGLAILDAGKPIPISDPTILRFRSLLNQLDKVCVEDKKRIVDLSVNTHGLMKEEGINQKMLPMLEGVNSAVAGEKNFNFSTQMAAYATLRNKGRDHNDTVKTLRENAALIQKSITPPSS